MSNPNLSRLNPWVVVSRILQMPSSFVSTNLVCAFGNIAYVPGPVQHRTTDPNPAESCRNGFALIHPRQFSGQICTIQHPCTLWLASFICFILAGTQIIKNKLFPLPVFHKPGSVDFWQELKQAKVHVIRWVILFEEVWVIQNLPNKSLTITGVIAH